MPSEIEDAIERQRRALLAMERQAASEMVRVYGESWARLRRDMMRLHAHMALDATPPTQGMIVRSERYQIVRPQIEAELRKFAQYATLSTTMTQRDAIEAALNNSEELIRRQTPRGIGIAFDKLNPRAVEALVGAASDGSPLRTLFNRIVADVAPQMTSTLARGIALGWSPRFTARELRAAYGLGLNRALVIARTETLRAYNEATHQNYLNHSDVLGGWQWMASLDLRTCASCWAMHGSVHPLSERMDDHPQGRCTQVPVIRGRASIIQRTGGEAFALRSEPDQIAILGPAAHRAYRDGYLTMTPQGQYSIVGQKYDPKWGSMRYARSLKAIVGEVAANRYQNVSEGNTVHA